MRIPLLDKLVYKEIVGPWIFGVTLFSVVLMAGTYLFRLTDFLVKGIEPQVIFQLSALYFPGLVAKTFPMAVLLASLLSFARLSNDSEIIAAQAGGASIFRIMRPVAFFGLFVSILTFAFGDYIVPPASLKAAEVQTEVLKTLKQTSAQPYSQALFVKGKFVGQLAAKNIDISKGSMYDAVIIWWGDKGLPESYFYFTELYYTPGRSWRAKDGYVILDRGNGQILKTTWEDARPPRFSQALDFTPETILASSISDYDALSMAQLQERIAKLEEYPQQDEERIRKVRDLRVGYWTKISLPLSGLVFALVGAPVSIRRVRQSVGLGVGISIMIIFAYYLLHNYLTVLAKGGAIHPALSAFIPVILGLAAAIFLLMQKNH